MPCEWRTLFGDKSGTATFSRRFHRPTNLEPHEQVFLVFDGIGGEGQLRLNDEPLRSVAHSDRPIECEVTNRLLSFNRLEVELQFSPSDTESDTVAVHGGLYESVALEIRS